jgi:DNA-binding MarR family transcriptional regulator
MTTATRAERRERDPTTGSALLFFRLARATGYRVGEALASLDMRTHEFAVLHQLDRAGPLSQQQLGAAVRINPSNLVGLLDDLQAEALVVRPRDPADRRRHLVELTAAGRRRLAQALRAVAVAEEDLLAPLSLGERKVLVELLERLARHSCAYKAGRGSC